MKSPFRLVCSQGASFLTKEECRELARESVAAAEKIMTKDDFFIFNGDQDLKIVVRMTKREVWIMTTSEANAGGLPSPLDN